MVSPALDLGWKVVVPDSRGTMLEMLDDSEKHNKEAPMESFWMDGLVGFSYQGRLWERDDVRL